MQGNYENKWDAYGHPSCWKSENNQCTPHFHNSMELLYVLEGQVRVTLNGETSAVKEGCFFISPSNGIHYHHTERHSYSYVLIIPMQAIPSYQALFSEKTFAKYCCEDRSDGEMVHCLEALVRLTTPSPAEWPMQLVNSTKGYLYILLDLILRETGLRRLERAGTPPLAYEILSYLQENYQSPISLSQLAQRFGYSESRFSHIFHRYFGSGLPAYVNMLRCQAAMKLMKREELTATEASLRVGFESPRTFYRAFRQCCGMTPTQYLNRSENPWEE